MKWAGSIACISVAVDCAERALGATPQVLFSFQAIWLWWVCAAFWLYASIVTTAALIREAR